jgi:hypothetical protein
MGLPLPLELAYLSGNTLGLRLLIVERYLEFDRKVHFRCDGHLFFKNANPTWAESAFSTTSGIAE